MDQRLTAILPCNDLEAAQSFFERPGFKLDQGSTSLDEYRMLSDGLGGHIHLNPAVTGWLQAGRNPFGLYLYREDVDGVAAAFADEIVGKPSDKPWACMSLLSMDLTERWFAWTGRRPTWSS